MKSQNQNDALIVFILGALMTVTPFSIDLYLPAFQQIADYLHTTTAKVSLSVSSYFIGFALGQIFYGPLLDRFGRKPPLYIGLSLFILASIGCLFSHTVEALVAFRFLQALGGCVAQVAAIAMVRDFFPVEKSAKILSLMMLILGVSPLLAPTAGGFIAVHFGWQWIFILLTAIAIMAMALTFFALPQGHAPDKSVSLKPKPIVLGFLSILKNPEFYTYSIASAFSFAGLLIYVAGSPIIFMGVYHVSPQIYGLIFALLAIGFLGGNQVNVQLLRFYKSSAIFQAALLAQSAFGILFLTGALLGWWDLYTTIFFIFSLLTCLGLSSPNGTALALAPFEKNAGAASSLIGFMQIGVASVVSMGIGLLNSTSAMPIIFMLGVTPVIGIAALMIGKKRIAHNVLDDAEAAAGRSL